MTQYIELMPSPASLIESLRSIGYSLETAVADVLDNSVAARASQIDIRFSWESGSPWLAVIDNGCGMSDDELVTAMRLGSFSPLERRDKYDLGRFGLGLKTATFSQCRQLTVFSKKDGRTSCYQWDIDLITHHSNAGWKLVALDADDVRNYQNLNRTISEYLETWHSGTIVLWEKLDRLKEPQSSQKSEQFFDALMLDVRKHLELVFHRFLTPDKQYKRFVIRMNNDDLVPFDPFNSKNMATQELPEQIIEVAGERIVVQPYILPHHNKVSRQEYEKFAGDEGYLHNQGFYVYRNRRLIIRGSWFRLIKKDELNKLIRVRVDIPNTLDHLWKLDVKKSFASPPEPVRQALQQVINRIEGAGRDVYRQRGTNLASAVGNPVWRRIAAGGAVTYAINREHPLIAGLLEGSGGEHKQQLQQLLRVIEYTFPVDLFYSDFAQNPRDVAPPGWNEEELEQLIDMYVGMYLSDGIPADNIAQRLFVVDPFASNRILAAKILSRKGLTS